MTIGVIAVLASCLTVAAVAFAGPVSHFNTGAGTWTAPQNYFGISIIVPPDFHSSGGHPGGYVSISDADGGAGEAIAAFSNYTTFKGDFRSRYGGNISFDLREHAPTISRRTRVLISSFRNGDVTLLESKLAKPTHSWKHYKAKLVASAWTVNSEAAPFKKRVSKTKLKSVLGHMTELGIIADYGKSMNEKVDLDNPKIGPAPHHH